MLPTPSTSHVSYENVYEPAEDSFLLMDTLSSSAEVSFLQDRLSRSALPPLVVEVGTGSGVLLAFLTAHADFIFGRADVVTMGTDINNFACKASRRTVEIATTPANNETDERRVGLNAQSHGVFLDAIEADLITPIRGHLIDVLVFNPPYVPTSELPDGDGHNPECPADGFARDSHLLALSYAGGADGMETTNRLLSQLPDLLSAAEGVAYVLLCAQNKPQDVKERISSWGNGWKAETVGSSGKTAGWERLQVLRIWRSCPA